MDIFAKIGYERRVEVGRQKGAKEWTDAVGGYLRGGLPEVATVSLIQVGIKFLGEGELEGAGKDGEDGVYVDRICK